LDLQTQSIVFETDRYRIEGKLTLPREGYRSRLSDFVNQRDRDFFSIEDAVVADLDNPETVWHAEFLMVARSHVRLLAPVADRESAEQVPAEAPAE
jgi:hypothetical protein